MPVAKARRHRLLPFMAALVILPMLLLGVFGYSCLNQIYIGNERHHLRFGRIAFPVATYEWVATLRGGSGAIKLPGGPQAGSWVWVWRWVDDKTYTPAPRRSPGYPNFLPRGA